MARIGVTYLDIAKAAQTLRNQGQEPTVDRVRERLGTGSKSTIAPLLKRWRTNQEDSGDGVGLSQELIDAVKSLQGRIQNAADDKIEQAQTKFDNSTKALKQQLEEACSTIAQLSTRQKDLEQELERAIEIKRSLSQSLEEIKISSAKTESRCAETMVRIDELKSANREQKQENRDIRAHLEHYQQRTAEDRQQERAQFRSTNQQLQDQIKHLTHQLTKAESQNTDKIKECLQHQEAIDLLGAENQALKQQIVQQKTHIESSNETLHTLREQRQTVDQQNSALQKEVSALSGLQSAAAKEVALVTQSLEKTDIKLKETETRLTDLTDENKIILQEKASILGQLKQLQQSL